MNPNYQLYFVNLNYLSQNYENSAYYYHAGNEPRVENTDLPAQSTVSVLTQNIQMEPDNLIKEESTTKLKTQNNHAKRKEKKESSISQLSMNGQQQDQQINLISRQKYGRNIISNILHHMINRFLSNQFNNMIQRIIKHYNISTTLSEFKDLLSHRGNKLGIYVKFSKIKALLKGHSYRSRIKQQTIEKQLIFNKIFRILYFNYLKNVHILHLYNTLKLKEKSKRCHIQGVNKLLELLKR